MAWLGWGAGRVDAVASGIVTCRYEYSRYFDSQSSGRLWVQPRERELCRCRE